MADSDRTASLMTPAKLAQIKPKSGASPAAWLSQMAADAGHVHVARLRELRHQLQAQPRLEGLAELVAALGQLSQALPGLDFALLQSRGWWARATGKNRSAGAQFAARFQQIDEVARAAEAPAQALRKQQERAGAADLPLLEVEVEYHALEKIIDQGARWLQDMRNQIKGREAAGGDPAALELIKEDTARCEILVARLKVLRAVSSAAQVLLQQARGAATRRTALVQRLQALASGVKAWRTRLSALAASASEAGSPSLNLDDAMEAHRELQLSVKQVMAECIQLQGQEKAAAEGLAAFQAQLEAA